MQVIYIIFFATIGLTFIVITLVIAGKDILLAFKRKIFTRGCDVYVANPTRNISHYYKVPKNGIFRIDKLPYITNPEKTLNLSPIERKKVIDGLLNREIRLKGRIAEVNKKKRNLEIMHEQSKDEKQKFFIMSQIKHFESVAKELEDKLRMKQENYFKDKRPAFFYIDGDPIPKDFYEYYSALDSKMVDNLVSRSISRPPDEKSQGDINKMKLIVMVAMGAAILAAYLAFRNNAAIGDICVSMGLACGL